MKARDIMAAVAAAVLSASAVRAERATTPPGPVAATTRLETGAVALSGVETGRRAPETARRYVGWAVVDPTMNGFTVRERRGVGDARVGARVHLRDLITGAGVDAEIIAGAPREDMALALSPALADALGFQSDRAPVLVAPVARAEEAPR